MCKKNRWCGYVCMYVAMWWKVEWDKEQYALQWKQHALVMTQYTFACVLVQWCWRQCTLHSALWEEGVQKGTDGVDMYGRNRAFEYRSKKEKELLWTTLKISCVARLPICVI